MFPYHGPFTSLHNALRKYRPAMEDAYREILGPLYRILEQADEGLLNEKSFINLDDLMQMGFEPNFNSKFLCLINDIGENPKFDQNGNFGSFEVSLAPAMTFTSQSIKSSKKKYSPWMPPALGIYIHEYTYFTMFALQRIPVVFASKMLVSNLDIISWPVVLENVPDVILKYEGTREEKIRAFYTLTLALLLFDMDDQTCQRLEAAVLEKMGFKVPDKFIFQRPNVLATITIPEISSAMLFPFGDLLHGLDLDTRILAMSEWLDIITPLNDLQKSLFDSLRNLKIQKVPFKP